MKLRYLSSLLFFVPSLAFAEAAVYSIDAPPEPEEVLHQTDNWIETEKIVLRGLDKISARVFTSEVMVNQKVHFGSLEIYVRSASRSPPEDQPESACFLEIFDNKSGQQRQKVFSGWMFASNPALSALEHPVYDIWVQEAVLPPQLVEAAAPVVEEPPVETEVVVEEVKSTFKHVDESDDDQPED